MSFVPDIPGPPSCPPSQVEAIIPLRFHLGPPVAVTFLLSLACSCRLSGSITYFVFYISYFVLLAICKRHGTKNQMALQPQDDCHRDM